MNAVINSKVLLLVLALGNIVGGLVGLLTVYHDQFSSHPWYLWLFVPDCPLYVFAFAFILLTLIFFNWQNPVLNCVVFVMNVRYALWSYTYFMVFFDPFKPWLNLDYALTLAGHFLAIIESFYLVLLSKINKRQLLVVYAWALINDYSDYVLGTHPWVPHTRLVWLLGLQNLVLTPFILSGYYFLNKAFGGLVIKRKE